MWIGSSLPCKIGISFQVCKEDEGGGARPKASVIDQHGALSIAKFPKETGDYSLERWEAIALDMAAACGITVAHHDIIENDGRPTFLSLLSDNHLGRCRQPPWPMGLNGRRACPSGGQPHRPN